MSDQEIDPPAINVRNNPESQAAESAAPNRVSRANAGGAPPKEAPAAGELPDSVAGRAEEGSRVAGVTISADDRADAVVPDDRRTEHEGPPAGHA